VAAGRSGGIRDGIEPVLNFSARKFPKIHVVTRECAFGKEDDITACPAGLSNEPADELNILKQASAKSQLGRCDLEHSFGHEINAAPSAFSHSSNFSLRVSHSIPVGTVSGV
jgi:hypothetical protein